MREYEDKRISETSLTLRRGAASLGLEHFS
jgi:hypothetical protein